MADSNPQQGPYSWEELVAKASLLAVVALAALFVGGLSDHKSPFYIAHVFYVAGGVPAFLFGIERLRRRVLRSHPQHSARIHDLFWRVWNVLTASLATATYVVIYHWATRPEDGSAEPVVALFGSVALFVEWARRTYKHMIQPVRPALRAAARLRFRRRYARRNTER